MRKICLAFAVTAILTLLCPVANAAEHTKGAGVRAGYSTLNQSAVTGLFFSYDFNRYLRLVPSIDYTFLNHNIDALDINVDLNVPIRIENSRFYIYPLAGVSYTSISREKATNSRIGKFGLDAGAGLDCRINQSIRLFAEGKYSYISRYSSGMVCIGIAYIFR